LEVQGKLVDAEAEEGSGKLIGPERACWMHCHRMSIQAPSSAFRFLWVGDPLDYTVDFSPIRSEFVERRKKAIGAWLVQRNVWRLGLRKWR